MVDNQEDVGTGARFWREGVPEAEVAEQWDLQANTGIPTKFAKERRGIYQPRGLPNSIKQEADQRQYRSRP
jgi:hypothetical protein